jgi:hypothetical protein
MSVAAAVLLLLQPAKAIARVLVINPSFIRIAD